MKKLTGLVFLLGTMIVSGAIVSYAQQHEHSQMASPSTAAAPASEEMEHIFCPTMKTGQVCSHGTAATLGLQGPEADAWITLAKKYNGAVNTATLQLFKDAEAVLSPAQMSQLKAWFAVGLNPQINELLYAKGLGKKTAAAAGKKEAE